MPDHREHWAGAFDEAAGLRGVSSRLQSEQDQEAEPVVSNQTVFVVDDDAGMRKGIVRLLRQHGFTSSAFDSVESFFAEANLHEALCVVVDVNLKGKSGIELKRLLASVQSSLPVIFVTGGDCRIDRAEAIEAGCVAFIQKPFTASALIDPIRSVSDARMQ